MANQIPYKVLKPEEVKPDYTSTRRHHSILNKIRKQLYSDRHNILFTDNTQKSGDTVTNYALHVDSLTNGKLGKLEKLLIDCSLSSEEVANSPDLYVDRETGKTEENESWRGDAINQKRFDPRVFTEVVRFDFGSPSYQEWAKDVWKQAGWSVPYEKMDEDKRDIWLFTEWDVAPILFKYFEAKQNRILFVNEVQAPKTEREKQNLLKGLQWGLYREKRYGMDHGDYVQRIPHVVWIVPFDLCAEFEDQYDSNIAVYELPDRNFLLHKPFNEWLKNLPESFRAVDEKRKGKYAMTITDYIKSHLEDALEDVSTGLKKTRQKQNLGDQELLKFLGLTQEELEYLEQFRRDE